MEINTVRYNYKIVVSGDEVEIYKYAVKQYKNLKEESKDEKTEMEESKKEKKSDEIELTDETYKRNPQDVRKMKVKLRRLINANAFQYPEKDKFITLTFKGKEPTRQQVTDCFHKFKIRLKRKFPNVDYKYIAVIERGTQGTERLHMHVIFFNLPFIKRNEFQEIWKYGRVDMRAIDTFYDLANYVVKYVEKTLEDGSYIPKGKRFYFPSRGLKKPNELFLSDGDIDDFMEKHCKEKSLVYETDFTSDYCGDCHYMKFSKTRETIPHFDNEIDLAFYLDSVND